MRLARLRKIPRPRGSVRVAPLPVLVQLPRVSALVRRRLLSRVSDLSRTHGWESLAVCLALALARARPFALARFVPRVLVLFVVQRPLVAFITDLHSLRC